MDNIYLGSTVVDYNNNKYKPKFDKKIVLKELFQRFAINFKLSFVKKYNDYIITMNNENIFILDINTKDLIKTIPTGGKYPTTHADYSNLITFAIYNNKLIYGNSIGEKSLMILDLTTFELNELKITNATNSAYISYLTSFVEDEDFYYLSCKYYLYKVNKITGEVVSELNNSFGFNGIGIYKNEMYVIVGESSSGYKFNLHKINKDNITSLGSVLQTYTLSTTMTTPKTIVEFFEYDNKMYIYFNGIGVRYFHLLRLNDNYSIRISISNATLYTFYYIDVAKGYMYNCSNTTCKYTLKTLNQENITFNYGSAVDTVCFFEVDEDNIITFSTSTLYHFETEYSFNNKYMKIK